MLIKAVHNKIKRNKSRTYHFDNELISGFTHILHFYYALLIIELTRLFQFEKGAFFGAPFLGSDVLRTLGLIRELKAFKFEQAALALDFKG